MVSALALVQEAGDDAGAAKDIAQRVSFNARVATAAPFGRALLTYGTAFPSHADPVAVPVLTLACVAMPREVLMRTDLSAISSSFSGVCDWPEFHNGVAAGLRMAAPFDDALHADLTLPGSGSRSSSSSSLPSSSSASTAVRQLRAWVRSHRFSGQSPELAALLKATAAAAHGSHNNVHPGAVISVPAVGAALVPPNPAQGGLLLAFGLQGVLNSLSPPDLYEHLSQTHQYVSVGLLLGLAAGRRGSMDPTVAKAIYLHLPTILPDSSGGGSGGASEGGDGGDLDVPIVVQVGFCTLLLGPAPC